MYLRRLLKNTFITLTFIIAITNALFYVSETITGKPILGNTLKVLGFCPAVVIEKVSNQPILTGPAGETGTTGAQGPSGKDGTTVCQAPINLFSLPGDLIPAVDNMYSLGNETNRWKGLQLGPGTLYIQDITTGLQAGLTVNSGTLLLDGADSLRIGNIRLTSKGIESVLSDQDITIGNITDRGYALFANGIKFPDGTIQTSAILQGVKGDTGAQGAQGAQGIQGIQGEVGSQGPIGVTGERGIQGAQGAQGIQGVPGSTNAYYGNFYSTQIQSNPIANAVNAMTFDSPLDGVGVTVVSSSRITVANAGTYNIQFSAQLDKTDAGNDSIDIWLAKNQANVTWSNTRSWLYGNNAKQVAAWNFIITLAANDFIQLYWSSADTDVRLFAETSLSTPARPDIPSVILTVTQVR
jgi:hypothetical protein